jgi:hypothetical protein
MQTWISGIKKHEDRHLYLFCGLLFLLKICILPFTAIVDADAVSRIFIAQRWLDAPHLITEGVWAPFHHYLNAAIISLTNSPIYAPVWVQLFFSIATLIPLYYFTKLIFSAKGAIFSTIVYALSPAVFRNSFMPLSETPYAFFVILSTYLLIKAIQQNKLPYFIYAGIALTIAAGLRYEAWILIALFTGILLIQRKYKGMMVFWACAMLFPTFWMLVGHIYHNDFLFGVSGAYQWNIELLGVNENINSVELVKRHLFFPLSVFIHLHPAIALLTFWIIGYLIVKKLLTKNQLIWLLPFLVLMTSFIIKAENGTLLLQHRFTISLLLFIVPFFSLFFEHFTSKKWQYGIGFILLTAIPFSFISNRPNYYKWIPNETLSMAIKEIQLDTDADMEAIPHFKNKAVITMKKEIAKHIHPNSGLLLDFTGWDNTFYWALHSGIHPNQIFIHSGAKNAAFDTLNLQTVLDNYPQGLLLIGCVTNHQDYYEIQESSLTIPALDYKVLHTEQLFCIEGWTLYSYSKDSVIKNGITQSNCQCPTKGSKEYIIMEIKQNSRWYNDVVRKSRQNKVSIDKMLELDAQYILDHQ